MLLLDNLEIEIIQQKNKNKRIFNKLWHIISDLKVKCH